MRLKLKPNLPLRGVGLADRRCLRTYHRLRDLTALAAKICQV